MEQMEGLDHSAGSGYLSLSKHTSSKPSPLTQTIPTFSKVLLQSWNKLRFLCFPDHGVNSF